MRRIFKMRNIARHRNDPERMPLTEASTSSFSLNRDRSPSVDTNSSTSSTETPTRRSIRSYGSFLPNYFNILRNSLRRSTSSQVRKVYDTTCSRTSSFKWTIYSMERQILICSARIISHIFGPRINFDTFGPMKKNFLPVISFVLQRVYIWIKVNPIAYKIKPQQAIPIFGKAQRYHSNKTKRF